jgi:hypothetical protein
MVSRHVLLENLIKIDDILRVWMIERFVCRSLSVFAPKFAWVVVSTWVLAGLSIFLPVAKAEDRFVRTVEDQAAGKIKLQMAIRRFERMEQPGPVVTMHSAIHIADQPFYDQLQALLDSKDVVLFESVKPPGTGRPEHSLKDADSDELKIATTKMRLRLLGIAAKSFERREKKTPADMEELLGAVAGKLEIYSSVLAQDGWGQPFQYLRLKPTVDSEAEGSAKASRSDTPTFDILSLGKDHAVGGEGAAADIRLTSQKPILARDIPKDNDQGIQAELAQALGLVFQLNAMSHDKSNWRNSDLSVDQVQERLAAAGSDGEELFKMLEGSSMQASVLRLMLGFLKLMPSVQVMGKVMMMEALSQADVLMQNMPGADKTMEVILKDRNQVVIDDLAAIIAKEPGVKDVGIIYGGAHMPDLEERLQKMGYQEMAVDWIDAITVDLPKKASERAQLESMRKTIRRSLEQQLKQLQKAAETRKAKAS